MKKLAFIVVAVWTVAMVAGFAVPAEKKESKESPKVEEPRKPANGSLIEVLPDGKVLWAADHDTVARALYQMIRQYEEEILRERIINRALVSEVARLSGK